MNIIIDLDLQQAVQGFGSRQPALPYQVKSQDTPTVALYFVRGNVTYDLGSSPGLRFGVFMAGNPNPLVQQNTFTRTTDNLARTVYVAYPNFNTVQMQAAIGSQPQLSVIGEIRYQTTFGTIARTADIDFTVVRTLLNETVMDNLIAAFVTPAVNANVTARINNTGWLSAGLNISIAAGAGAYQVVSVTNATDFVAKNLGGASNAASGTTIPNGTAVGIAPVNVLQAYPDPSIIEVTTHKDVVNGYAGLDGTGLLKGTEMPVDGTTIAVSGGKLTVVGGGGGAAGEDAYTTTSASFVVPAVGVTVSVPLVDTDWMGGSGFYVFITGAGYYAVSSITDATHAVLTNAGGTSNAIAGTTVPSGATVTPGGPVGPAGAAGAPGAALSAYDALTSSFVMPAAAANVTISIANTAWLAVGQVIYIASAGYFQVASISSATQASVANLNYPGNASAGGTIVSGSKVSAGGLIGATGSGGAGKNAFTNLAANFTQPAINLTVSINVGTTAWMAVGQVIFVQGGGYYSVASITDLTDAVVTNLGYTGNASPGATVTSGSTIAVTPGGLAGAGRDSFTTTTASFTQPAVGSSVTVTLASTAWMAQNQYVFISGGGTYSVASVLNATQAVLLSVAATGNVSSGSTVPSGSAVSPSGPAGPQGAAGPQGPAGSGGGGGAFDPRGGYFAYEDFETNGPTSNFPYWSGQATVGSGAAVKWSNVNILSDSTHKAIGIVELQTGNVTGNSGCFFCYGGTGINSTNGGIMLGPGTMDLASRMAIETSLPATGTGYLCRFGFQIANAVTPPITPVNSVFLEYSPDNNSGNLRLGYNTVSGAIIYVNTSQALTADTFAWWELKIDTSGNITAYFNGVSIATAGPIAGLLWTQLAPFWYNFRNSGTAIIYLAVDTLFASMPYTR